MFGPNIEPRVQNFEKNSQKKIFFLDFLENYHQKVKKVRCFGARSPSKLVYIDEQGAFRTFLGLVAKMDISKQYKGRTLCVARGSNP